jgi:threonine dehydratase
VPIGRGGLISGISVAAKSLDPHIKIVGVESEGASVLCFSWKAGKIVEVDSLNTVADCLAVRKPAKLTFRIIQKYVDSIFWQQKEKSMKL